MEISKGFWQPPIQGSNETVQTMSYQRDTQIILDIDIQVFF